MTDTIKISRELIEDLRDLAFEEVERHRQAMGAYRRDRQARMEATIAKADALLATPPADAADMGGQAVSGVPCECGCPVGYVSGERFHAEHERVRELRASLAQHRQQSEAMWSAHESNLLAEIEQHRQQAGKLAEALRKLTAAMACHDSTPEEYNALAGAREALAAWEKTSCGK